MEKVSIFAVKKFTALLEIGKLNINALTSEV